MAVNIFSKNNTYGAGGSLFTSGFNSPRDDQEPISKIDAIDQESVWRTMYTVTTGKTLYITQVTFGTPATGSDIMNIGRGSASDYQVLMSGFGSVTITFTTPLKYPSATAVQWEFSANEAAQHKISFVGWEE